ncbi:MAG: caspase family protein [bacterium]|nr:caspase family protein [bacterium]
MRKLVIVLTILTSLLAFDSRVILPQVWKTNIEEVYQKPDRKTWGDIYSWSFNRREFNKSFALVIGISDYTKAQDWPRLESPYSDAIRVRDFLIHDDGFDYVVTLTNGKATQQNIKRYMEEIFPEKFGENDRFLFYFSGHGTQQIIKAATFGYLVLQNCGLKSYSEMITMEDIERWDRLLYPKRHVLFILDCCFSGLAGQQHYSALTDKKLERLSQYAHYLITAGTADEESVASLLRWNGSLFTDSFLKAASGSGDLSSYDYQADGVVSLKELMKYIGDRIDDESTKLKSKNPLSQGIKMSPQISDLQNNEGEFFFISRHFKNRKVGNVSNNNLDHGWPIETKGVNIEPSPKPKTETPPFISPPRTTTTAKLKLRSEPASLSREQVKAMLAERGFYERSWNATAQGYNNQFETKIIKEKSVVVDHASGLMWQKGGSANYITYDEAKEYWS